MKSYFYVICGRWWMRDTYRGLATNALFSQVRAGIKKLSQFPTGWYCYIFFWFLAFDSWSCSCWTPRAGDRCGVPLQPKWGCFGCLALQWTTFEESDGESNWCACCDPADVLPYFLNFSAPRTFFPLFRFSIVGNTVNFINKILLQTASR